MFLLSLVNFVTLETYRVAFSTWFKSVGLEIAGMCHFNAMIFFPIYLELFAPFSSERWIMGAMFNHV